MRGGVYDFVELGTLRIQRLIDPAIFPDALSWKHRPPTQTFIQLTAHAEETDQKQTKESNLHKRQKGNKRRHTQDLKRGFKVQRSNGTKYKVLEKGKKTTQKQKQIKLVLIMRFFSLF